LTTNKATDPKPGDAGQKASFAFDKRAIWAIALPAMVTNVATALIGLGDMWIVGQLANAPAQGAVDIGARIFAVLFTVMNFLKSGTTGLVAQAGTRSGANSQYAVLIRGMFIGLVIGALLLLLKPLLLPLMLSALGASDAVLTQSVIYADIRYWSAPAVMLNLAMIGFLVGRRQMTAVLIIEVGYNALNIALGLWFVLELDFGIAGIGWSSVIAEYAKLLVVGLLIARLARDRGGEQAAQAAQPLSQGIISWPQLRPFLAVNRDLFLRTVILMLVLAVLTRLSAERGEVTLAANGIIYQLFVLTALLLDGFENAAQVLNAERLGAKDAAGFNRYIKAILIRGFVAAACVAAAFAVFSAPVLDSFAATKAIAENAQSSAIWLILIPFAGVAGFVFDGVFVGASWTRAMLASMLGAAMVFAIAVWLTWPLGNQALWGSFVLFLVARAAFQAALIPRLSRQSFAQFHEPTDGHNARY
jgi:MATE family multidrug resistance protein